MSDPRPAPPVLPDHEAREAIRSELGTTLLVEAGAGSGKTTSLVSRLVSLLAGGGARAQNIAAVTFTRKAASHLRQRFQEALEDAYRAEPDPPRRERLGHALGELDRITIGTIHSFCGRLLGERPVEAGVDPLFLAVERQEADMFRALCWREFVSERQEAGDPILETLAGLGLEPTDLEESFGVLADYPDVEPVVDEAAPAPDFSAARAWLANFLRDAGAHMPSSVPEGGWDKLQENVERAQLLAALPQFTTPAGFARVLLLFESDAGVTQNRWGERKKDGLRLEAALEAAREDVLLPSLAAWRRYLHPRLMAFLRPALETLQARRRAEGHLTFEDLLLLSRNLLRDHPAVRRYFQQRLTHVLVDEFQDTDPIQAELLLYLTGVDTEEKNVRRLLPRPGSLFVVGDPKQSIFRFRRADISTYNTFRETILRAGGRVLTLSSNFRSVEEVTAAVNETFRYVFPREATPEQAAFTELRSQRPDGILGAGAFRLVSRGDGTMKTAEIVAANAMAVARWIRWAIDTGWPTGGAGDSPRPARAADFLVLTAQRDNLELYAREMERLGIAVDVSGSKAFRISEGLRVLRPFLAAVQDPDDDVSIVAFLVGPLSGVDDDALYRFRRAGGRFSYLVDAPSGSDPRILRGFALLREAWDDTRHQPPATALSRICDRLGLLARTAAMESGRTRSGNLLKVLALARRLSGDGLSLRAVLERLQEDAEALDLEEMNVEPSASDAVRLMNIHRAKGLEAPVVILAEPRERRDREPILHVSRGDAAPRGWFTLGKTGSGPRGSRSLFAVPPSWEERREEEARFEEAEQKRLLYVAATRAMNTLLVSVHEKITDRGRKREFVGPWAELNRVLADAPGPSDALELEAPREVPELAAALAAERPRMKERKTLVSRPTLSVTPVTRLAKTLGERRPAAEESAHGAAWGRILHSLLELAMRNGSSDLELLAENLIREEGLEAAQREPILQVASGVLASDLWRRARNAERRLVEVPFTIAVPSSDLGLMEGPAETLLKGAIDLVFREGDTWLIVDYKSDAVGGNLEALVAHYAPQVRIYRRYWESITRQKARAGLFFLDTRDIRWVDEGGGPPSSRPGPWQPPLFPE
jgi:ATP-dependent helicase/nuclease subunit A